MSRNLSSRTLRSTYNKKIAARFKPYFDELLEQGPGAETVLYYEEFNWTPRYTYTAYRDAILFLIDNASSPALSDKYQKLKESMKHAAVDDTFYMYIPTIKDGRVAKATKLAGVEVEAGTPWRDAFIWFINAEDTELQSKEFRISGTFTFEDIKFATHNAGAYEDVQLTANEKEIVAIRK